MSLHARGKSLFIFVLCFPIFLMRRAIPFIVGRRFDAIKGMAQGALSFWFARHDTFVNELAAGCDLETLVVNRNGMVGKVRGIPNRTVK
jgi:hypothetical protein